jgi:eukaryotic-like serine/threonine-protein kinase
VKECFTCRRCFGDHNEICDFDESPLKTTLAGLPIIADRYRLDERIGTGALGACYLGFDIESRQRVAIKVILPEYVQADPNCVPIFFQEVQAASGIDHPNVVHILNYGKSESGFLYVVMEFLEGPSLKSVLKQQGAISLERAINLTCAISYAVNAAHIRGQFHRDLKPSNMVLLNAATAEEKGQTDESLKVLDFGLSRIKSADMLSVLPPNKYQPSILGTPYYVPPEQCEREEFDERSEIYSIGIILYQMLTGEVPFKGHSYPSVIEKHINEPPRPPSSLRPDLPENIETVLLRAIEKDPARRFQSVLVLSNLLRQALKHPGAPRRTTWGAEGKKTESGVDDNRIYSPGGPPQAAAKRGSVTRQEEGIQSVVSDLLASIEPPPPRPTRRLKIKRRTDSFEVPPSSLEAVQSAQLAAQATEKAPPIAVKSEPEPGPAAAVSPPQPAPVLSGRLPANQPGVTRRKLPPPPPHEDRPEKYQKRTRAIEETERPQNGFQIPRAEPVRAEPVRAEPVRAEPVRAEPARAETAGQASAPICLIEPIERAVESISAVSALKSTGPAGRTVGTKAEARPVALSPAAFVYLFSDQFLPPKKLRQYKREMHNFFVVERESLASLLLVVSIVSLRRRNSLKLSPVNAIVPLLRRKLDLGEDEKFVLQLVNGAVKPLDVLERHVLESLGKQNAASLQAVYDVFAGAAGRSGRAIAVAELLNDTIADELAEYSLIESGQKPDNLPLDPGESNRSYRANDDEIGRYFSQLDDVKQLIASVKGEEPITVGTNRVQIFDYLFNYYKDLFRRNSG